MRLNISLEGMLHFNSGNILGVDLVSTLGGRFGVKFMKTNWGKHSKSGFSAGSRLSLLGDQNGV